jgi:DNA-binding NarL/FixJ family response regulator
MRYDNPTLTAKQVQVLALVAAGKCTKEIAAELGKSVRCIANHREAIANRIGTEERTLWVHFAIYNGFIGVLPITYDPRIRGRR